jgi:autotransporter-associated beta strand protein
MLLQITLAASQLFLPQGPGPATNPLLGPQSYDCGSIGAVVINPFDPTNLFIGGSNGGIWRTTNSATSWVPQSDNQTSLSIASLNFDPLDTSGQTLIAGVGNTSNGALDYARFVRGGYPLGVLYTQNGGNTWTPAAGNTTLSGQSAAGVIARGSTLLVGTFEPTAPTTFTGYGLFRSTNRGNSFSQVTLGPENSPVTCLIGDYNPVSNPNTLYAAIENADVTQIALYRSTNGGSSWGSPIFGYAQFSPITGADPVILKAAVGPSGTIAVAVIDIANLQQDYIAAVFYSSDSGATWHTLYNENTSSIDFNPEGQGTVNSALAINPSSPNTVIVSGSDSENSPFPAAVYSFTLSNGVVTSTSLITGPNGSLSHADTRAMVINSSGNLLLSSDGGLAIKQGITGNWSNISGNICVQQPYSVVYDGNNNIIVSANQDTWAATQNAPNQAASTDIPDLTGDGTNAAINDQGSVSYYYSTAENMAELNRVVNNHGTLSSPVSFTLTNPPTFSFSSPLELNHIDASQIALGADTVYLFQDDFTSSTFTLTPVGGITDGTLVCMDYGAQDAHFALAAGSYGGSNALYYTSNAKTTPFTPLTNYTGGTPDTVVFDPRTSQRLYIVDSNYVLWSTTNAGTTFSDLTGHLPANLTTAPQSGLFAVGFVSNNGVNALFAGGQSANGALSNLAVADSDGSGNLSGWRLFGVGQPNAQLNQITYNSKADVLVTSLYGRGGWIMYDLTSNFASATTLQFGKANNDSTPDASILTNGDYANRPLAKYGTGTLTITGSPSFSGNSTIHAGRLVVASGATLPGDVNVVGGTIGGSGVITGTVTVQSAAVMCPGNSIGTLSMSGLTLNPGAITLVELDPTLSSLISVSGTASLAGNVEVIQDAGTYPMRGHYEILTAGNVVGAFDSSVLGANPGFSFSLSQLGNIIYLNYIRQVVTTNLTGNQLKLANFINSNPSLVDNPDAAALISLTGDAEKSALDRISPSRNSFGAYAAQNTAFAAAKLLSQHLREKTMSQHNLAAFQTNSPNSQLLAFGSEKGLPFAQPSTFKNGFWAAPFALIATQDEQEQNPSFNFQAEGGMVGRDYMFEDNYLLGGSIGYAHIHQHDQNDNGHASMNFYFAALYSDLAWGQFYLNPALFVAYVHDDNVRKIQYATVDATAKAHIHSWQLMPQLELGYTIQKKNKALEPFALLDWSINWQGSYTEKGSSLWNWHQKAANTSFLRSEFGCRFYQNWLMKWGALVLSAKGSYVNKQPFGTGTVTASLSGVPGSVSVESFTKNQSLAGVGLFLLAHFGQKRDLYLQLAYDGEYGAGYSGSEFFIKFTKLF